VFLRDFLSTLTDSGSLVLGVTFVIVVMVFRRGVLGEILFRLPSTQDRRAERAQARSRQPMQTSADETAIHRSSEL
jgi:branched-chain amino acid transport system permease protein